MDFIIDIFWVFPLAGAIILIVFGRKKLIEDHIDHQDLCDKHYK